MKSTIRVQQIPEYRPEAVQAFVEDSFRQFGGAKPLFKVTTHPALLGAVCKALRDCSVGEIAISDSPAFGSLEAVALKAGYGPLAKRYGARILPLANPAPLATDEGVLHLKISADIDRYDRIINLPKVKSHVQMTLTLGIKNLFGLVIGKRKPVLHCLVKNDKVRFGRMLVDIARRVAPCLTLADGIVAMQGNGPAGGTPYRLGVLAAGEDLTALDRVLAEIVGAPLDKVYTLKAARQKGYGKYDLKDIELHSNTPLDLMRVADFRLADQPMDISFNPLRVARSYLRQLFEVGIREKWARRNAG
jgi:uncharacterized protein (DUF362 family)